MTDTTLVAVGDVSFGDHYACASIGVNAMLKRNPDLDLFADVRDYIRSGDLAFVNLETVISDIGLDAGSLRSMHMRGRPHDVHRLKDAGFNVVNVANNHMLQHGSEAFRETVALLRQEEMGVVGLAQDNGRNCIPYETRLGDRAVVFLGYGFEKDLYFDGTTVYAQGVEQNVLEDIRLHKTQENIVICSFHWGKEFISYPQSNQISLARKAIEAGCDLILGHHPHVLNGFENYQDRLIFYSLGNFVFDQLWNPPCREGCLIKMAFANGAFRIEDLRLTRTCDDYVPIINDTAERARERFGELNIELKTTIDNRGTQYDSHRQQLERKNQHASWMHMFKNLMKYDRRILRQLIGDTLSRKIGLR